MNSVRVLSRRLATSAVRGSQAKKVNPKDLQPMIYPYTLTARLIQFPYKYYFNNSWMHRYLFYSFVLCYPLWIWIHFKGKRAARARSYQPSVR